MSQYDLPGLYEFLAHTPEQGLRKMLVDNKPFSEAHFNLMLKIVRNCNPAQFCEHWEKKDFPKLKMSPGEMKIKEKFWSDSEQVLASRGLLTPALPQKAA